MRDSCPESTLDKRNRFLQNMTNSQQRLKGVYE